MEMQQGTKMVQSSEAVRVGALLALAGGFLDAYTYLERDRVFANTQTGNFVMLGFELAQHNWANIVKYLLPILSFSMGIVLVELVRSWGKARKRGRIHWRQIVLAVELLVVAAVGFMPATEHWNMTANIMVSFACGLQVEAFRRMHGKIFATTMCTGNLRSGTELTVQYLRTKDKAMLQHALNYYGVIIAFVIGAAISGLLVPLLGIQSIWVGGLILFAIILLLFADEWETPHAV